MSVGPKHMPATAQPVQIKDRESDAPNFVGVRHVGLFARDPLKLAGFYRDVMGMALVRQTAFDHGRGGVAFLSRHPAEEDHDVVLVSEADAVHTAFRVSSLGDLLAFHRMLKEKGVAIQSCLNHVVELAVYFRDPEGHLIEVYWVTGMSSAALRADPINLEGSEEQVRRELEGPPRAA